MKVHTGVDADSGVVHSVAATAAHVHDAQVLPQLLHGLETEILGDAAYQSKETRDLAQAAGIAWRVCERGSRNKALTRAQRRRNRAISRVRAYVEHPYRVVKHLWGHMKVCLPRHRQESGAGTNAVRLGESVHEEVPVNGLMGSVRL
jgi:IS5 family transposase